MGLFSRKPVFCTVCNKQISHKHKPKKDWGIKGFLCGDCHLDKMREFYEKKMKQSCLSCGVTKKDFRFMGTTLAVGHGWSTL